MPNVPGRSPVERAAVRVRGVLDEVRRPAAVHSSASAAIAGLIEPADVHDDDGGRVSGPRHASTSARSNAIVCGSQSTNRSRAPACTAAAAVAKNVFAGTMTSRPSTPSARRMISSALGAGADRDRVRASRGAPANAASSSAPIGPSVSWPVIERVVDAGEDLGAVFGGEVDTSRGHTHRLENVVVAMRHGRLAMTCTRGR